MRRALAFLTPLGGARAPSAAALAWFPVVGAVLGLALGAVWWAAATVWPGGVAAAVVVAADLGLTGFLHLDGLVDAADGLLPPLDRQRRLDVMADPRAGAFGVGAAVAVLLVRWSAFAALRPHALLVAALWCASRTAMAVVARSLPYARPSGLATAFLADEPEGRGVGGRRGLRGRDALVALAGLGGSVVLGAVGQGVGGVAGVAGVAVGAGAVAAFAHGRLGGFTGDVLGAAGLVGETAGMLVAAVRW